MLLKIVQNSCLEIADTAYLMIMSLSFLFVELKWKGLVPGRAQVT